jgi:hypothetical protein
MAEPSIDRAELARALQNFRAIPEVESHKRIYHSLLNQMGYECVTYTHGPFERGKDFVYIHRDEFGDSVLTVCQVKNERLTGRASESGSVAAVINQLFQCKNTEVLNPLTHEKELPKRVVLFTAYEVPDSTVADQGQMLVDLARFCKIVGPEKIIRLIKRYLPDVYSDLVYPGEGTNRAILRYVNSFRELAAFGLSSERELSSLFVNLGASQSTPLLEAVASGRKKMSPRRKSLSCSLDSYRSLESASQLLATALSVPQLVTPSTSSHLPLTSHGVNMEAPQQNRTAQSPEAFSRVRRQLNRTAGERDRAAASVTFRAGDFEPILEQLCWLRSRVMATDSLDEQSGLLVDYIRACILAETVLRIIEETVGTEWLRDVPIREKRPVYELHLDAISPDLLLALCDSLSFTGEAGAGKTSLSKILVEHAIRGGEKCLYFPCSRIRTKDAALVDEIGAFLRTVNALQDNEAPSRVLEQATLIVLDGCDEAASFTTRLGRDVRTLRHRKDSSVVCASPASAVPFIPSDIAPRLHVQITPSETSTETVNVKFTLVGPLGTGEFDRLIALHTGTHFVGPISQLRDLQRINSARVILTTRNSDVLNLNNDFIKLNAVPFNDAQLAEFFTKWFSSSPKLNKSVRQFLDQNKHIKTICRNPMVATLIASLCENGQSLPHSRTDIYERRFILLAESWDRIRGVANRSKMVHPEVARAAQVVCGFNPRSIPLTLDASRGSQGS